MPLCLSCQPKRSRARRYTKMIGNEGTKINSRIDYIFPRNLAHSKEPPQQPSIKLPSDGDHKRHEMRVF